MVRLEDDSCLAVCHDMLRWVCNYLHIQLSLMLCNNMWQ